jgi:hypothetical protein
MPRKDIRIAVLGAGPVGLEAALYARRLGLAVTVYERGRVAEHWQRFGHVRLFSPFGMNATPLGRAAILATRPRHDFPADADCVTAKQHFESYLQPLSEVDELQDCVRAGVEVLHVARLGFLKHEAPGDARRGKQPFRLTVRGADKRETFEEADVVLDCTGTYGQHRWLGDGGVPALGEAAAEPHLAYGLEDVLGERRRHYAGKNVLVIGSGYSAATAVCDLATLAEQHPDTWVIWLARGARSQPIQRFANDPLRERDRLALRANTLATRTEGNVEYHPHCVIDAIECPGPDRGFTLHGRCQGQAKTWAVERVIANVGYTPHTGMYRELQVHECYASLGPMKLAAALLGQKSDDCLKQASCGPDALRNPEPNFFILGQKSYGRGATFLLRTGFEQVRDVFTLVTGQAGIDLYKKR